MTSEVVHAKPFHRSAYWTGVMRSGRTGKNQVSRGDVVYMPESSSHGPMTALSRAGSTTCTQRLPFHRWVTNVGSGLGTSPSSQAFLAPLAAIACKMR